MQKAVSQMRPKYAEAVVLHDLLGHDLAEVARLTDISVAAAQSRLVRGRKDLVRRVKQERRHV
jgi:DNA-directed RNA polymerase specialized sigma24 family protein